MLFRSEIMDGELHFRGNIFSPDGKEKAEIALNCPVDECGVNFGTIAAQQILNKGADSIVESIRK